MTVPSNVAQPEGSWEAVAKTGSREPSERLNSHLPLDSLPGRTRRLHLFMLSVCVCLFSLCAVGSWIGGVDSDWRALALAVGGLLPVALLPGVLWHDAGRRHERDAAFTLPWIVLLTALIPWAAVLSGRLGLPLRDALFLSLDDRLGFSVPAIVAWTSAHSRIGAVLNHSYSLLFLLLPVAAVLPAVTGYRAAKRFLLANTIAFLVALPMFALLPAIGPWTGYHTAGSAAQRACEASIMAIRSGRPAAGAGIVCFPSFHVIWAVLSAAALWPMKPLRIPATVLAILIVISTVTTGWHYVVDSLAGLVLAAIALACADRFIASR
jgi:hypothetical protein